jgi:hypothetical protein
MTSFQLHKLRTIYLLLSYFKRFFSYVRYDWLIIHVYNRKRNLNDKLEKILDDAVMTYLRQCPSMYLSKATELQHGWPNWDRNPEPNDYEGEMTVFM